MSPSDAYAIISSFPELSLGQMIFVVVITAAVLQALRVVADTVFGIRQKALDKTVKSIREHKEFEGVFAAYEKVPEMEKNLEKLVDRLDKLHNDFSESQKERSEFNLHMLEVSLTELYYKCVDRDKFNVGLYTQFSKTKDLYNARGGNGLAEGYDKALRKKWEKEISRA